MTTDLVKLEREKRKTAREERAWKFLDEKILTDSNLRIAMVAAIIAYATHEARSSTNVGPVRSALSFALPGIGIPLIAADAGIRDKYALGAISAVAISYVTGQMLVGWGESGVFKSILPEIPTPADLWQKWQDMLPAWMVPPWAD